jgi:para-nitrobenzyl esterase
MFNALLIGTVKPFLGFVSRTKQFLDSATRRRSFWSVLAICTLVTIPTFGHSGNDCDGRPIVRAKHGLLQGTRTKEVERFLGIPFAAPPLGELRFAPPEEPPAWEGVRDAGNFGERCMQYGGIGSEDCLFLNVYRPAAHRPNQSYPVLVWIHGGSYLHGYGADYDPSRFSHENNIIVVTINYRLNAFGFLALPSLTAESDDAESGNYGLMDQQAALRWVQSNIGAFGGDPTNVTIDGESAGGWSVCSHLASPLSAGLFSKAIIQSGSCFALPLATAEQLGSKYAAALGCADAQTATDCLRALPADVLAQAATEVFVTGNTATVVGGRVLPVSPQQAVSTGNYNRVPVLMGNVRDEMRLFGTIAYPLSPQTYPLTLAYCLPQLPVDRILSEYPASSYAEPIYALTTALSDSGGWLPIGNCLSRNLATIFSATTDTYLYEFDDPNAPYALSDLVPVPDGYAMGATHGSELAYLFDLPSVKHEDLTREQQRLSTRMIQYFGAFARSGNPNSPLSPFWPKYHPRTDLVMGLRPHFTHPISDFAQAHHCDFWNALAQAPQRSMP